MSKAKFIVHVKLQQTDLIDDEYTATQAFTFLDNFEDWLTFITPAPTRMSRWVRYTIDGFTCYERNMYLAALVDHQATQPTQPTQPVQGLED